MRTILITSIIALCLTLPGCASKKTKDISYFSKTGTEISNPKLNIFVPRKSHVEKLPILIFVHGGNWDTGNKDTYGLLGRNFAKRGIITVIPDYTLSPNADYNLQTAQIAQAIHWVQRNAAKYGGDANRIYITGHSAGGHLAALAVMNPKYGIVKNTISGIILNDAAGLDMKNYLEQYPPTEEHDYLATWSNDPEKWRDASPIYFLDKDTPPFLIYVGDKTYESIKVGNERFLAKLLPLQPKVQTIHVNKSHIPMVLQYFFPCSKRFGEIKNFIESHP